MPEISRFYGIVIRMYFVDHNPPHFHADYQGFKAEYDIQTLKLLNGALPNLDEPEPNRFFKVG
jgi:hypothetical protein